LVLSSSRFTIRDGLLFRVAVHPATGRYLQLVIPETCREDYLQAFHDNLGHMGYSRTYQLARQRVWWPRMATHIRYHVEQCHECTFAKERRGEVADARRPELGRFPFQVVLADVLHLEVKAEGSGFDRVLCFIDSLSRWPEARPFAKALEPLHNV
jgi:hypothetical protein